MYDDADDVRMPALLTSFAGKSPIRACPRHSQAIEDAETCMGSQMTHAQNLDRGRTIRGTTINALLTVVALHLILDASRFDLRQRLFKRSRVTILTLT